MEERQRIPEDELEKCDKGGVLEEDIGGEVMVPGSGDGGADDWGWHQQCRAAETSMKTELIRPNILHSTPFIKTSSDGIILHHKDHKYQKQHLCFSNNTNLCAEPDVCQ